MRINQSKAFRKLRNESDKQGSQFIMTELKLALLFLDIASHSFNWDRRKQMCKDARRSYETVLQALPHLSLSEKDAVEVNAKLCLIRTGLEHFGMLDPMRERDVMPKAG